MRALSLSLVLAMGLGVAHADEMPDPDSEVAQRHFQRGAALYDKRDYEAAIAEFKLARQARPVAELDYNIGRCYDRLEKREAAIVAYAEYLANAPESPQAADVRERIRVLATRQPALDPEAADTGVRRVVPARPRTSFGRRYGAPIGVGAGALVLGLTATGLLASVVSPYHSLADGKCAMGCPSSRYRGLETRADVAYGLFAAAGVAVVVDFALWIRAVRR